MMKNNRKTITSLILGILLLAPFWSSAQYSIELVGDVQNGDGEFSFINEEVGFHFSNLGISKTTDGGNTWIEVISNIRDYTIPNGDYLSGQFINETTGWIVVYDPNPDWINNQSLLYKTTDGGLTWELNHTSPPNEILYSAAFFMDLYFKNENEGWVYGKDLLQYTNDGGETWSTLIHHTDNITNNHHLKDLSFSSEGNAVAVGFGSWIIQSSDGGITWEERHFNGESVHEDYYISGVDFENAMLGYSAVRDGFLKKTVDGGMTWEDISTGYIDDNNDVCVDQLNTVWVAAGNYCNNTGCYNSSRIAYSRDLGETWITIRHLPDGPRFTDIVWPSPNYGFACNAWGEIYKITIEDLGIEDGLTNHKPVYPNPATDQITIDNSNQFNHATISNLQGQVLVNSTNATISINNLAKGIYWVSAYTIKNELISTEKIVKY